MSPADAVAELCEPATLEQLRRLAAAAEADAAAAPEGRGGRRWAGLLATQLLRTLRWLGMCGGLRPPPPPPPSELHPPLPAGCSHLFSRSASEGQLPPRTAPSPPRSRSPPPPEPRPYGGASRPLGEQQPAVPASTSPGPPAGARRQSSSREHGQLRAGPALAGPGLTLPAAVQHLAGDYRSLVVSGQRQVRPVS